MLLNFAKGFLCGVAVLVPGLGGSSAAIALGVFSKLINSVTELFRHPLNSLSLLLPFGCGGVAGAVALSHPFLFFQENFPTAATIAFISLSLIGTLIVVIKYLYRPRLIEVVIAILGAIAWLLISLFLKKLSLELGGIFFLGIMGIILAAGLLLPGISFSYLLVVFGIYTRFLSSLHHPDISFILPLCAGIASGLVALSSFVKKLLTRFEREFYAAVCGFMLYSAVESAFFGSLAENVNIDLIISAFFVI